MDSTTFTNPGWTSTSTYTTLQREEMPVTDATSTVAPEPEPVVVKPEGPKVDSRKIRAWAISQGIEVGKRGRIKPEVIASYNEAQQA